MEAPVDHLQESLAARRLKESVALALGETLLQVEAMGQREFEEVVTALGLGPSAEPDHSIASTSQVSGPPPGIVSPTMGQVGSSLLKLGASVVSSAGRLLGWEEGVGGTVEEKKMVMLREAREKLGQLEQSLKYSKNMPDGGAKTLASIAEVQERIHGLKEEGRESKVTVEEACPPQKALVSCQSLVRDQSPLQLPEVVGLALKLAGLPPSSVLAVSLARPSQEELFAAARNLPVSRRGRRQGERDGEGCVAREVQQVRNVLREVGRQQGLGAAVGPPGRWISLSGPAVKLTSRDVTLHKRKVETGAPFRSSFPSEQEFTFRRDLLPSSGSPGVITRARRMVEAGQLKNRQQDQGKELLPSSQEEASKQQQLLDQFKEEMREKEIKEEEWSFVPNKEGEEVRRKLEREKAEIEARRVRLKSRRGKSVTLAVFQAGAVKEGRTAAASQWGGRDTPGSSSASATVLSPYFPTSPFSLADEFIAAPSLRERLEAGGMGDCPLCGREMLKSSLQQHAEQCQGPA